MKPKITTGMLFICAALLGAFIWFVERNSDNSMQENILSGKVFEAHPDQITWIHLERGDTVIECTRTAGEWEMILPVNAPVNNEVVERMIAGMANVERGELITAETMKERGITPADYGFDEPRATITFKNNHGTFTWLIGRNAPLGESLYVMAQDSKTIIATAQTLLNLVPEDPAWIRDRTLFTYNAAAVHGIDLRRTGGIIQLRQDGNNRWMLQQPVTGNADLTQVSKLIDHAIATGIVDFIREDSSDLTVYGLEEPVIELTLLDPEDHPQTLLIGKKRPEKPEQQYAKWADKPAVFTVASDWINAFELDSSLLRSRRMFDVQPERVSAISISSDTQQINLIRTNNQWQVTRPARWSAEKQSVQILLEHLTSGMITNFIDTPDDTLVEKAADAQWTVELTTGPRTQTLRIAPDGERLILQRNDETTYGITDAMAFIDQFADPLFYRNRTLLQIDPPQIKRIDLQTADGTFHIERSGDSYTTPEIDQTPNTTALTLLTAELIRLRSDLLIAFNPDSLEPYGLETPEAQLTITLSDTNALGQVILFGHSIPGGRYAMLRGQPLVFILPEKTADTLTRELTQPVEDQTTETEQP